MSKRKLPIFFILVVFGAMIVGFTSNNSWQSFLKIVDNTLRGIPGGIVISEKNSDGREIIGGYILQDNNPVPIKTEKHTLTINKGTEGEYSFSLVKFIKDGQVLSISPEKEGSVIEFVTGNKNIVFTVSSNKGLWVADTSSFLPTNIQPETVNGISQNELNKKRSDLANQGKDPDSYLLYWAVQPLLSPSEDRIAFGSNRAGFPENTTIGLWMSDLQGDTDQVVQESDDITPITWINDTELVYVGEKGYLKKVDLKTKAISTIINNKVSVNTSSPDGAYIIYQNVDQGQVLPDVMILDANTGNIVRLDIPSGFTCQGFYGWDESSNKVAFYVQDLNLNLKLVLFNPIDSTISVLEAPENTRFDDYVVPSWTNGKVVISADGKTFITTN